MAINKQLIFVYNAKSGQKNTFLDSLKKFINPSEYECNLCALTHGLVSEKTKWKKFRKQSGIAMEFFHADEYERQFKSKFGQQYTYPIILIQDHYHLDIFMNAKQINEIKNLDAFILAIEKRWQNSPP